MKTRCLPVVTAVVFSLLIGQFTVLAQAQRGGQRLRSQPPAVTSVVQQALLEALTGPDGEYVAYAEYAAIIEKFGEVQPYASIIHAEERHIAALKRQFEVRGLTVPENPYLGKIQVPATLEEAAEQGVAAEERNVALYDQLLTQVKDQPGLVKVFTHLQFASREHHLPAFKAALAKGGQLEPGEFTCGMGGSQQRGGPPPWAGGRGQGLGRGSCCGACLDGATPQAGAGFRYGRGQGRGVAAQLQGR
ncbi:MAG TPA: hypothetical protein VEC99_15795 [Clostridia bacterium]|nr:hypothetical protein [Clostridia bacterium]